MKTEAYKLYSRDIFNISAKCHQSRSLQFWAIPFQSWCVFLSHVYKLALLLSNSSWLSVCCADYNCHQTRIRCYV